MREFGLIGKPLSHSFSKKYFTEKFAREGITDCSYENFELQEISELPALIKSRPNLEGLNITIPYKEALNPYSSACSEQVNSIGATNCIRIKDGKIYRYNTDAQGFMASIYPLLKPHHTKALVLGSGGASKAVYYGLRILGVWVQVVSRAPEEDWQCQYSDIGQKEMDDHTVIVNTTPLGMYPNVNEAPPIDYSLITPRHLMFDLIYNPAKTKFLELGEARGATIKNGYEMLVIQAEESWKIWNGTSDQKLDQGFIG